MSLADEVPRRCSKCGPRPLSAFHFDRTNGRYYSRCGRCRNQERIARARAEREARGNEIWHRLGPAMLRKRFGDLISAARAARRHGMFRGHDGIRAYRDLLVALEAIEGPDMRGES